MVVELYDTERSYVEALQILVNVSILIDSMDKKKKERSVLLNEQNILNFEYK